MAPKKHNIIFLHPDLGIGGAERLVIDAAVGLKQRGHKVTIFTSHCDPKHCFDEARDGTLDVRVRGDTIIPSSFLGRFAILCAILRQLHLILQIAILSSELADLNPTAFFVDQLSAGVPLLRFLFTEPRALFYCHFPDQLLAQRGGILKKLYRWPFDLLESWSTGCADGIVVNSKFTKSIFGIVFPGLKDRDPTVVYPCVDTESSHDDNKELEKMWPGIKVLLSINRFEKKKDVGLAIKAYAALSSEVRKDTRLVLAGGYDPRVSENVQCHKELEVLATELKLIHATAKSVVTALAIPEDISVLFLLSVPNALKATLLSSAKLLVYTPRNEHFGIVPLEAMLAGVPVLAANEGGPLETVVEEETGWLRDASKPEEWTAVMEKVLDGSLSEEDLANMGENGIERVEGQFSKYALAERLEWEFMQLWKLSKYARPAVIDPVLLVMGVVLVPIFGFVAYNVFVR